MLLGLLLRLTPFHWQMQPFLQTQTRHLVPQRRRLRPPPDQQTPGMRGFQLGPDFWRFCAGDVPPRPPPRRLGPSALPAAVQSSQRALKLSRVECTIGPSGCTCTLAGCFVCCLLYGPAGHCHCMQLQERPASQQVNIEVPVLFIKLFASKDLGQA